MKNEYKAVTTTQSLINDRWRQANLTTTFARDIHKPWRSVYGFPMMAARLAARYPLVLHCREDESFALMTKLNDLLENPESLGQAYKLLTLLEQEVHQQVSRLIEIEQKPITADEIAGLVEAAEQCLTEHLVQTKTDRLASMFTPNIPGQQLRGKSKMLARLQQLNPVLESVKDKGFRVIVFDKRRKAMRPHNNSETATGLKPVQYHLTLWSYLLVRGDHNQSRVWN